MPVKDIGDPINYGEHVIQLVRRTTPTSDDTNVAEWYEVRKPLQNNAGGTYFNTLKRFENLAEAEGFITSLQAGGTKTPPAAGVLPLTNVPPPPRDPHADDNM